MTIAESINNAVRADRPESPTDIIFIYACVVLFLLWIYATVKPCQIPHIESVLIFITGLKGVKVWSDKVKGAAGDTL